MWCWCFPGLPKLCKQILFNVFFCPREILLFCSLAAWLIIFYFPITLFRFSYLIPHIGPWPNKQQYLCMSLNICVWGLSILCQLTLFFSRCQRKHQKDGNGGNGSLGSIWFEFILLTRLYLNKWSHLSDWHQHKATHRPISLLFSG